MPMERLISLPLVEAYDVRLSPSNSGQQSFAARYFRLCGCTIDPSVKWALGIMVEIISKKLSIICSSEFEGREEGKGPCGSLIM